MKLSIRALAGLCFLLVSGTSALAACTLTKVTEMPLIVLGDHYAAMVQIGDVTRPMLVDTGAAQTILKSSVADELKLTPDSSLAEVKPVFGIGQTTTQVHLNVIPSVLGLGDLVLRDRSTVVADMDDGASAEKASAGLLGDDILSQYEVEFDFPSKKLTFYRAFGCYGAFTPWTGSYSSIPFVHDGTKIIIDVILNDERTRAIVDTGADVSVVSRRSLALWGMPDDHFVDTKAQIGTSLNGGSAFALQMFLFDKVTIGKEVFPARVMRIADIDFYVGSALLGLDYWKTHKIWISYRNGRMFLADKASTTTLAYPVEKEPPAGEDITAAPAKGGTMAEVAPSDEAPADRQISTNEGAASTAVDAVHTEPVLHRSIMKDQPAWLLPVYSLEEDCESLAPTVTFSKPPDHGAASMEVRDRHAAYPAGSPLEKCNARTIPMIVIKYTPAAGYIGEDTITIDEAYADGKHRIRHVDVTVD
ncbi:retroviral-like aspartic protease family protein [Methylocapsa sp. S129]|uniref:retroviral-like aspartic protease family protein n=1 Tax=Methylocapsa sp. S129 TaxID=1641869 RepID=UPI00131BA0EB|nr:retroviral-like aspartic protease family protein [Methylocapsa sp. S129]